MKNVKIGVTVLFVSVVALSCSTAPNGFGGSRNPSADGKQSKREIPIGCLVANGGFQVFNLDTQQPLGSGWFSEKNTCQEAVNTSHDGFVCAAQAGGAIVVDVRKNVQVGAGNFDLLASCEKVLAKANHGLVCGADSGGTILYSRHAGKLGSGYFSNTITCDQSVEGASNSVACGAQDSGFGMYSTRSGRQLGAGTWSAQSDCFSAAQVVKDGQVCVPEAGQVRIEYLETGVRAGYYPNVAACQADL